MSSVSVRLRARAVWYSITRRSSLIRLVELGPMPFGGERVQMRLVVEARHRVVRLRLESRAGDAPAGERLEHRQAAAMQQLMHQRGDEYGLARAGQAGDAEPDGRVEQIRTELAERARGKADFFRDVGEGRHAFHIGVSKSLHQRSRDGCRRTNRRLSAASQAAIDPGFQRCPYLCHRVDKCGIANHYEGPRSRHLDADDFGDPARSRRHDDDAI